MAEAPAYTLMPADGVVELDRYQTDNLGFVFAQGTQIKLAEDLPGTVLKLNGEEIPRYGEGILGNNYDLEVIRDLESTVLTIILQVQTAGKLTVLIPGESYTLNGEPGIELYGEWNLVKPKEYAMSITPEIATDGSTVLNSFRTFTITFGDAETVEVTRPAGSQNQDKDISIMDPYLGRIWPAVTMSVEDGKPVCTLTCDQVWTEEGLYTLSIPADFFLIDGTIKFPVTKQRLTFNVEPGETVDYTLTPADGSTFTDNPEIIVTFPGAKDVTLAGDKWSFSLYNDSQTFSAIFDVEEVDVADGFGVKLVNAGQMAPNGNLTFRIDEGTFVVDGVDSQEIIAHYVMDRKISNEVTFYPEDTVVAEPESGAMANIIFDEGSMIRLAEDYASNVVVKFNDAVLTAGSDETDGDFALYADYNVITLVIANPEYNKEGALSLNISGSAYTISGEPGFDVAHSWNVVEGKEYAYTITPDLDDTTVTSLEEVLITFTNAETAEVDNELGLTIRDNDYNWYKVTAEIVNNEEHPACKVTLDEPITEAGEYTFTIGMDTFLLDGLSYFPFPAIELTFTVNPLAGVETVEENSSTVTVVSVDGRVLYKDAPAEAIKTLDNGIYIINGKKAFIKK